MALFCAIILLGSIFYRPQRKFAKVMFLHMSVILSTGGGGIPACIAGGIPACFAGLGGSPGPHPGGSWGVWPGGSPGRGVLQAHTWGVSRPTPKGALQAHTQGGLQATLGGCTPACTEADPPPYGRLLPRVICILVSFSVPNPYLGKISTLTQSVTREDWYGTVHGVEFIYTYFRTCRRNRNSSCAWQEGRRTHWPFLMITWESTGRQLFFQRTWVRSIAYSLTLN